MKPRLLATACAAALLALPGCSKSKLGAEVEGTVTLDGNPCGPGVVVFAPVDGKNNPATGAIQLDGAYELRTNRTVGANPGHYRVSVTVYDQPEVKPGERSTVAPKLVTPTKYADITTSGLEFDVQPGDNSIDLKLTSQ
jgi:hypothetical protein